MDDPRSPGVTRSCLDLPGSAWVFGMNWLIGQWRVDVSDAGTRGRHLGDWRPKWDGRPCVCQLGSGIRGKGLYRLNACPRDIS